MSKKRLVLRVDRRQADPDEIERFLHDLQPAIKDLSIEIYPRQRYWDAPDEGQFRDYVPFALLEHQSEAAIEYLTELLLEELGWLVDLRDPQESPDV